MLAYADVCWRMLTYRSASLPTTFSRRCRYTCVGILLCLYPHAVIYVSSYCYTFVLTLRNMCPHTALCVGILLCLCPHAAIYAAAVCEYSWRLHRQHTSAYVTVSIRQHTSPHAAIYAAAVREYSRRLHRRWHTIFTTLTTTCRVSAYCYTCVLIMNLRHAAAVRDYRY